MQLPSFLLRAHIQSVAVFGCIQRYQGTTGDEEWCIQPCMNKSELNTSHQLPQSAHNNSNSVYFSYLMLYLLLKECLVPAGIFASPMNVWTESRPLLTQLNPNNKTQTQPMNTSDSRCSYWNAKEIKVWTLLIYLLQTSHDETSNHSLLPFNNCSSVSLSFILTCVGLHTAVLFFTLTLTTHCCPHKIHEAPKTEEKEKKKMLTWNLLSLHFA